MKIISKIKNIGTTIILSSLGGILGALGGTDNGSKSLRRIIIPLLLCANAYNSTENLWVITIMSMAGILSLGYGIPDVDDIGSSIGQFWYKFFPYRSMAQPNASECPQNRVFCDVCTRMAVSIGKCFSMLVMPILRQNWSMFGIYCLGIIISDISLGGIIHPKGGFNITAYNCTTKEKIILFLNWEEFLMYGLNTLLCLSIIYI